MTVALYILAVLPAALFQNMGNVLAITGAIAGSCLSYIGPGLVYIGIHGGRFMELLEQSWLSSMVPNPSSASSSKYRSKQQAGDDVKKAPTLAVETTPLVGTQQEAADLAQKHIEKVDTDNDKDEKEWMIVCCVKFIVWHVTLCPLWVALARGGRTGLTRHIHDMALKSPHPIRIGDVEYSRAMVNQLGRVQADPEVAAVVWPSSQSLHGSLSPTTSSTAQRQPPLRSGSDIDAYRQQQQQRGQETQEAVSPLPFLAARGGLSDSNKVINTNQLARSPGAMQPGNLNQQIGQGILQRQKLERKQQQKKERALEADPQEAPPSWYDFAVAIFFILFGLLAMVAGVLSLFISGEAAAARRW